MFKRIAASIFSALVMFGLAGLWNLVVFPKLGITFTEGLLRESPIFFLIILGYLVLGTTLVFIGVNSNFSSNPRWHWIIVGILVMETAFGFSSLVIQANYEFPLAALPYDLIWYLFEGAAGGLTASFFLKKNS